MGLFGLPFDGIKEIREARKKVEAREQEMSQGWIAELKREMLAEFGYSLPIGLARIRDKSYAPVGWRNMAKKRKLVGGLESELGQQVLAGLPDGKRQVLMEIERKRIYLNYTAGLVQYEIVRLKRLEREFDTWRRLMRTTKSGSEA